MSLHNKSVGCCFILIQGTAREIKGAVALTAMKVVVMSLSGAFIQSPERWMGDPFQPPVIDKKLEIPVDRCLVERLHELAAVL
jgi:hypothetical protein